MVVLQTCVVFIHMCLIPYFIGGLVLAKSGEKAGVVLKTAAGLVVSYALYEVLVIGMQILGKGFRFVSYSYCVMVVVLALPGVVLWLKERKKAGFSTLKPSKPDRYMILAFVLIAVQLAAILLLATPDEDDAFYLGLSSMSLAYDYLLEYNAYMGLMNTRISTRYILSGLPVYQASLSLLSGGLHHLVIAHNLFPLFYIPLAYAVYYEIGKVFLRKEGIERANGKFLCCLALLHLIGNYYIYSPENFLVTRIWQGKALFVALGIPCLWFFAEKAIRECCTQKELPLGRQVSNWGIVACTLLAVVFMGETGLYLGSFMLGCLTLVSFLVYKNIRALFWAVLSWVPTGLLFVYLWLG